jgi:hypothetical protein
MARDEHSISTFAAIEDLIDTACFRSGAAGT